MSWFHKVNGSNMMWEVENTECLNALEELNRANYQEKAIIARSDSHQMVFFEGEDENGGVTLFEVSVSLDGSELNTQPIKTNAGTIENLYEFPEKWNSISVEDTPPIVRTD
jgi:hypothetical protein